MSTTIAGRGFGRFMMQVLWPAFLVAVVAVGIFFSLIDPREIDAVGRYLADSREAAYTVGFFVFWALFTASSALTYLLIHGSVPPPPERFDGSGDRESPRENAPPAR